MSFGQNKENRPGLKNLNTGFVPISPVREQVAKFGSNRPDSAKTKNRFNEIERLMDQNKVSRNLSDYWVKNSGKPYNSYVKKIVTERLKYDAWPPIGPFYYEQFRFHPF